MSSFPRLFGSHRLAGLLLAATLVVDAGAATIVLREGGPGPGLPVARPSSAVVIPPQEAFADRFAQHRDQRAAAVNKLLARRAAAIRYHDRVAFLADLDPRQTAFVQRQTAMFDALARVPIGSWSYLLDADREVSANSVYLRDYTDEVWVPDVTLYYQLSGFDPEPTQLPMHYTFVAHAGHWVLADDADFPGVSDLQTARDLWDYGPVDVVATPRVLVLGHTGRRAQLTQLAADADAALPAVTAVVGTGWVQKVVILAPASIKELSELIGIPGDLSQIAAVAIAQVKGDKDGRFSAVGNRVVVNPVNYNALGRVGRRIVLRHEITHVATRAYTGVASPTWLVEGMADYVGYLTSGVSTRVAAKELRAEVRAGRIPKTLPTNDSFDGGSSSLSVSYEGSWLACRLIAERAGQEALIAFYRRIGTTAGPDVVVQRDAFRDILHTTPEAFLQSWRSYLRAQLG